MAEELRFTSARLKWLDITSVLTEVIKRYWLEVERLKLADCLNFNPILFFSDLLVILDLGWMCDCRIIQRCLSLLCFPTLLPVFYTNQNSIRKILI